MSNVPDIWGQLTAAFEEAAAKARASAEESDDESVRQKFMNVADLFQNGKAEITQAVQNEQQITAELAQAKELASKSDAAKTASKAKEAEKAESGFRATAKKMAAVRLAKKSGIAFDRQLGKQLKQSLFLRLRLVDQMGLLQDERDHLHDLEEWARRPLRSFSGLSSDSSLEEAMLTPGPTNYSRPKEDAVPVSQRHERYRDRVISLARRLPRREAVWWATLMASQLVEKSQVEAMLARVPAARPVYNWIRDPTEENAKVVENIPDFPGPNTTSGCIARAILWRSVPAREQFDLDHPMTTAEAVARAILLMADSPGNTRTDPRSFLELSLQLGEEIRTGRMLWDTAPSADRRDDRVLDESWDEWFSDEERRRNK